MGLIGRDLGKIYTSSNSSLRAWRRPETADSLSPNLQKHRLMSAATNRFHVSPFWARRAVLLCGAGLSRLATAMSNTTVNTTNLETLKNCIHSGRPLITVANHDATIDDPVMFAALPCEFWHPDHMRWALGAREICFTNPLFSCFFSAGQVIPIDRGMGVMQPAMDHALTVLNQDKWVHIFPEGSFV